MFGFNPFSAESLGAIHQRIKELRAQFPELGREELAWGLIREKCWWCAIAGALTALPAVMPGLGTLIALLSGAAVDITILGFAVTRLVLELATLYGRNPATLEAQREAFMAFALAAGIHTVNQRLSRLAAAQLSRQLTAELTEKLLLGLGVRASQRQLIPRLLPFAGIFVAGIINYFFARAIGAKVLKFYRERNGEGNGPVIDVTAL
ncbi:hypothetical protein [Thermodesulfitimonas autotrophica]|uniref:hypothetical protein n=1 Tax=Thermodesulfitimonas autotrophica TaxID=1894989 RepID=UPI002FE1EA73